MGAIPESKRRAQAAADMLSPDGDIGRYMAEQALLHHEIMIARAMAARTISPARKRAELALVERYMQRSAMVYKFIVIGQCGLGLHSEEGVRYG